jgi:iron complex transport system substrate-binding protein
MEINKLTGRIVDAALRLHKDVGPGLLESVYEVLLADRLRAEGLLVERQKPVPIRLDGKIFDEGFRADLVVNGTVIVEIKSIERLTGVHKKQLLTNLRFSGLRIGLLINFGGEFLKGNVERIVLGEAPDLKNSVSSVHSV